MCAENRLAGTLTASLPRARNFHFSLSKAREYSSTDREMAIYLIKEPQIMSNKSKTKLTSLEALGHAAECLKTLAHPHRLRMVQLMLQGQHTVGELAAACEIASHMASEHLRLMQRCGFLKAEKDGRFVYYSVVEPHLANIMSCIEARFGVERVR